MIPFKGRTLNPTKPVEVYRNLHRPGVTYSVRQGGHVIGHAESIVLHNATFVVHEAGRLRVLATGRKNVHAWVRGRYADGMDSERWHAARYNPRRLSTFVDDSGAVLVQAFLVRVGKYGISFASPEDMYASTLATPSLPGSSPSGD